MLRFLQEVVEVMLRRVGNAYVVSAEELFKAFNSRRRRDRLISFKGDVVRFKIRGRIVEFPEEVMEWEAENHKAVQDFLRFVANLMRRLDYALEVIAEYSSHSD